MPAEPYDRADLTFFLRLTGCQSISLPVVFTRDGRPVGLQLLGKPRGDFELPGAASALEAIGCVMTLESGVYPPTIGYETPDPECDVDVVANVARKGPHDIVLNNSLAFGGYNSVTCIAKPYKLPAPSAIDPGRGGGETPPVRAA